MLGVDWMSKYNPITFDFPELRLSFIKDGKKVILRGAIETTRLQQITVKGIQKLVRKKSLRFIGQLFVVSVQERSTGEAIESISPLFTEYNDVFQEPKTLPPHKSFDHSIKLKEGSQLVNARPYRHPFAHKNEIEKLVKEMLENGIIQYSTSPFSSPLLLVKKKMGLGGFV